MSAAGPAGINLPANDFGVLTSKPFPRHTVSGTGLRLTRS
ncbi:Mycobacterium numidiamassiliense ORFan [Mycobacterium numidiamassiliense]|jgi:hypothetical protein|uniref:Mycobacterium numidiamassiliense ORFan n=1 Tax=Mycobacterium numidiamassiliense TaxID=1841861 RepID=A0A2U3P6S8_9MYCO|nr:Mycobacterium numidiamassiliense ORFan [Mycobacterium numidiamassiliense]